MKFFSILSSRRTTNLNSQFKRFTCYLSVVGSAFAVNGFYVTFHVTRVGKFPWTYATFIWSLAGMRSLVTLQVRITCKSERKGHIGN